jgi:hypothetical protein
MKTALNMSDVMVKDAQKIAKLAKDELSKLNKSSNDSDIVRKLNKEIETLVKRKEICMILRKEINSKETVINVKEKLINKKRRLEH